MAFSLPRVWPLVDGAQVGHDFRPSHDSMEDALAPRLPGCHLWGLTSFAWTFPMLDKPPNQQAKKLDPALLARFAAIVGEKFAITDPDLQAPYLVEMRNMFQGQTPVVLRPASVAEVSAILKLANDTR